MLDQVGARVKLTRANLDEMVAAVVMELDYDYWKDLWVDTAEVPDEVHDRRDRLAEALLAALPEGVQATTEHPDGHEELYQQPD